METLIDVRSVSKAFRIPSVERHTVREHALDFFRPRHHDRLTVLDDISFELRRGESLGLSSESAGTPISTPSTISNCSVP